MRCRGVCVAAIIAALCTPIFCADNPLPAAKPVPRMQAVPQPYNQVSFQREGEELARFHFGKDLARPFVFPVIGPAGRSLTRMGHPHDPETHSHHNSVWISHDSVDGTSFWTDAPQAGKIVHVRTVALEDGDDSAAVTAELAWRAAQGKDVLRELRTTRVKFLPEREWLLVIDIELRAERDVTLGQTPFGLIGVRMAKTIGVNDGGGTIRNSAGAVNEAGVFRKPAKWVDYSGPIAPGKCEGTTLFDHPGNPGHPACFHVRDDGWMGASLTLNAPLVITPKTPLRLRYGLYVHAGAPDMAALEKQWTAFCALPPASASGQKETR